MRTVRLWWQRALGSFTGARNDAAMADELQTHIDMQIDENVRAGMPLSEARRQAHITFGTVDAAKEGYRDQRGLPFVESTLQDIGYAIRSMRGNPGFTAVAVLSIAIGIGANTAIFSVVKTVLLDPLGYREPGRLFAIRESIPKWGTSAEGIPASPLHAREWGRHCPSIERISVMRLRSFHFVQGGEPELIGGAQISANLPELLGMMPVRGRTFMAHEEQAGKNQVVLIAESLWRRKFKADPAVVGNAVTLDGGSFTVVGILPGTFRLPFSGGMLASAVLAKPPEIFMPLVVTQSEMRPIGNHNYGAIARLRPGATAAQALAEINLVQKRFPEEARLDIELRAVLIPIQDLFTGSSRTGLWMLLGAVGAVMLIVCVNLANLLLAKNSARRRESAIRSALGASAGRQLRQGLTESVMLSLAGGTLGVALAALGLRAIARWAPPDLYRAGDVQLDPGVLTFALLVSIATGLIFGALPAWQLSGANPIEALQSGAGRSSTASRGNLGTRRVLIGMEVALSATLLILGGLLTSSFVRLMRVEKGFRTERVLAVDLSIPDQRYREAPARARLLERTLAKVRELPGVKSAGLVSVLPGRGESWIDPIAAENDPRPAVERPMVNHRMVSPDYFRTMNIEIRQGRALEATDQGRAVGMLSMKAAARVWPGVENPVGRRYKGMRDQLLTLIGVAADVRATVDKEPPAIAYYPYWTLPQHGISMVVRGTSADPMMLASAVRTAVWSEEAQMPIPEVTTMSHVVETSMAQRRFQVMLVMAFSGFALVVAALGIYGVVAFTVARRRNELGIRLALGAEPGQLMRTVIAQGLTPVAVGLTAGVGAALALGRLGQGLLFEVRAADPATIAVVCAAVLIVAVAACSIPARKALSGNPVAALRIE